MIGVFDSGYGGLSVLRHLRVALPDRDFVYLGDSGRAPYGGRSVDTILDLSEQAVEWLFDHQTPDTPSRYPMLSTAVTGAACVSLALALEKAMSA